VSEDSDSTKPSRSRAPSDAASIIAAIDEAARRLEEGAVDEAEAEALAASIVAHAGHARSNVRQAVARAAEHLPEDAFEAVIAGLLRDPGEYVKRAATGSFDARSRRRRATIKHEEASAGVRALRAQIADDLGKEALREANRLTDRVLAEFVERLDHELRKVATPLRLTMAHVRDESRRTVGERLAARAEEASRMLDVLLGISTSARAQLATTAPRFREETLRPLVDEHVALLRARVGDEAPPGRLARLDVVVDVDQALAAEIDRGLFGQALANLLQNAVEAHPADGDAPIHVRVSGERRRAGTLVALTVEDRGAGMSPEMLARIGEAFTSSKGGGRGLGVLNVKRMVETVHGGTLEIASEVGRGTRMTAVLPRRQ
jgi:signal transduction histidine kinase